MKSPIHALNSNLHGRYGIAAVLLVATVGLTLAVQGWNSRLMNFDHVNFIDGADRLLSDGVLPDRGDVSSYLAFATPGTVWLMAPGMLVFDDPRLYELVGSAALYVGTLFGLFLLARMCFDVRCAYLSVLLYGLSRNGMFNAGSLWSIGHPFFYVWMIYFCLLWAQRNNANYLSAAVVTWSAGMYVDMVLAPAIFAIPAIWVFSRPRIRVAPLLLGALIVLAIWYPFLRFQSTRDFADLKSVVARQRISAQTHYKDAWCMPALVVHNLTAPDGLSGAERQLRSPPIAAGSTQPWYETLKQQIRVRSIVLKEAMTFNFDQMTWTPMAALPLFLMAVATLAISAIQGSSRLLVTANTWNWRSWIPRVGSMSLLLAILGNEVFVARFLSANGSLDKSTVLDIRTLQAALLLTGGALLLWKQPIGNLVSRLMMRQEESNHDPQHSIRALLALAVVVPWLALSMVVEAGYAVRYFWLWPLQLVLIVAAVTYIPERLGWPRSLTWLAQISLTLILLTHPWVISPVQAWVRTGWSGPRASDIQAVDYIASEVLSQGRNRVSIGYQTFMVGFMASMHSVDPRYKVGAELDLFFKHRYGISNSNQCAEGVSADDEYRIVQKPPQRAESHEVPISWAPLGSEVKTYDLVEYFDVPLDPGFRLLRQFGEFQVFRRDIP